MTPKTNEGYTISDSISIGGDTYVLGHNPNAPSPFVTWMEVPATEKTPGYYTWGHYFASKESAQKDLFRRAMDVLPEQQYNDLVRDCITEEMRSEFVDAYRNEIAYGDIENCLEGALEHLGIDDDMLSTLMADEQFKARALHVYRRQDHSYENEALTESLESLLKDKYADLLPKEFTAVLKISPEEMDIINDVLSLTQEEIEEKYGQYEEGCGMLEFSQDIQSPIGYRRMAIFINPKTSPEEENSIDLVLLHPDPFKASKRVGIEVKLRDVKNLEQVYSVKDEVGRTWSIDLHADERLRRIGRKYIFDADVIESPEYEKHNKEYCTVLRPLDVKEHDKLVTNILWKVEFNDGTILDAWDHELRPTRAVSMDLSLHPEQQKPAQDIPLAEKIAGAKGRVDQSAGQEMTSPEHQI